MQVKRFVAPSMRMALKMVREELGDDAVILSNKRVAEGIELLISADEPVLDETAPSSTGIDILRESVEAAAETPVKGDQPNKLQLEIERIQQEARGRAEALAASLAVAKQEAAQPVENQEKPVVPAQDFAGELQRQQTEMHQGMSEPEIQTLLTEPSVTPSNMPVSSSEEEISSLRAELQSMRDLMEMQLSNIAWGQFSQRNPQQASIWRRMKRMGLAPAIVDRVLGSLRLTDSATSNWQQAMKAFSQSLPVLGKDLVAEGGTFALVGPTGVGKTTTIAKLAARYVLQHGADDVALVTTDTHRLAAYEQLRTVGRILGVPVKMVDKQHSLEQVLYSLRHKGLVLIDTAGLSGGDQRLQQQLKGISELGVRVKTLLVLAATAQAQVMQAAYDSYQTDNMVGSIITKLDETLSLGEVLSLLTESQLPIVYTAHGQAVPNDLALADREDLARLSIQLAKAVELDEQSMADELVGRRKVAQNMMMNSLSAG
jgi:flagellar biosynthesis protein FlhF